MRLAERLEQRLTFIELQALLGQAVKDLTAMTDRGAQRNGILEHVVDLRSAAVHETLKCLLDGGGVSAHITRCSLSCRPLTETTGPYPAVHAEEAQEP